MVRALIAIALGFVLGITGPYYLFLGAYSLIPWGLAGVILGYFCGRKRDAAVNGALYGFVLSFAFMIAGYTGTAPLSGRLPFFAILGVFGATCGLLAAVVGSVLRIPKKGIT